MKTVNDYPVNAFSVWYNSFIAKYGGYDIRKEGIDIPKFMEMWRKSHNQLVSFIGGWKRIVEVDHNSESKPLTTTDINKILDKVGVTRSVFDEYVSSEVWRFPYTKEGGSNNNAYAKRSSKVIIKNMKGKVDQKQLDTLISCLGEAWENKKGVSSKFIFEFSCDPRDAFLLGHHEGVDHTSCFRNKAGDTSHSIAKPAIATDDHSFILRVYDSNMNIMARAWGAASTEENALCGFISNMYFKNTSMIATIVSVVESGIKQIFNNDTFSVLHPILSEQYGPDENGVSMLLKNKGYIYFNSNEDKYVFYNKKEVEALRTDGEKSSNFEISAAVGVFRGNQNKAIVGIYKCPKCGSIHYSSRDGWDDVDGVFVCRDCVLKSSVDELTGTRTSNKLIDVINEFGEVVKSSKNYVEKKLGKCALMNIFAVNLIDAIDSNGEKILVCPDTNNFIKSFKLEKGVYVKKQ